MRLNIILLLMSIVGVLSAEDITTESVFVSDDIEAAGTTIEAVSSTAASPQATDQAAPITTRAYVTIARTTAGTPIATTTTPRATTTTPRATTTTTTLSPRTAPARGSRGRTVRYQNTADSNQAQLLPIKVIKSEKSVGRGRSSNIVRGEGKQLPVTVIKSEPLPTLITTTRSPTTTRLPTTTRSPYRSHVTATAARSYTADSQEVSEDEEDNSGQRRTGKSSRRNQVRYLTGKELGLDAPPINFESKYQRDNFKFAYETKDGQKRSENGNFENMGTDEQTYVVKGSYSYFDKDGIEYIVNYTADARGFHPVITVNNPNKL